MKVAITGKGGTGKTTLSALMARSFAEKGQPVIAIDADPDTNLASALGVPLDDLPAPLSQMKELIRERTDSKNGYGSYFKINPDVRDLPEKYACLVHGVRLLTLGGVASGGSGCICPESALLKALVTHALLRPDEVVILDMEAGVEHLGRATAQAVTMMIVVIEPGQRSVQTALNIKKLADEIHIPRLGVVINKALPGMDITSLVARLDGLPVLGTLSFDPAIAQADLEGQSPYTGQNTQHHEIETILNAIAQEVSSDS